MGSRGALLAAVLQLVGGAADGAVEERSAPVASDAVVLRDSFPDLACGSACAIGGTSLLTRSATGTWTVTGTTGPVFVA